MGSLSSELVKPILWIVKIEGYVKKEQDDVVVSYASGFSIRNDGVILTCAHILSPFYQCEIRARRLDEENFRRETTKLYERPSWDLLLLRVHDIDDCKVGKLAADGTLSEGDTLFHAGNPFDFVGSFMIGHACYRCVEDVTLPTPGVTCDTYVLDALSRTPRYRIMGHVWNEPIFDDLKKRHIKPGYKRNLNPSIPIIQCGGFTCGEGCSGGPIFNSQGEIVGMLSGNSDTYSFGLHVTILREFVRLGLQSEKEMAFEDNSKGKGAIQRQADASQGSLVYNKVKPILWVVKVEGRLKGSLLAGVTYGTGFSIRNDGIILTCAHLFSSYSKWVITVRNLDEEHFIHETTVLYERSSWDLLLLRVQGIHDCNFAEFAADGTLSEGETLFHVGHPLEFIGSFLIGHTCYRCVEDGIPSVSSTCATYVQDTSTRTPPYRILGHIFYKEVIDELEQQGIDCTRSKNMDPLVQIIQCNAFACAEGCSGGLIFNTRGQIVGMLIGDSHRYSYGLHVTALREFVRLGLQSEKEKEMDSDSNPKGKGKIQSEAYTSQVSSKRLKR